VTELEFATWPRRTKESPLKRFASGVLCALTGYIVAAVANYFLVLRLSSDVHHRSVEAAMTSAFFFGPIGAVVAFAAGLILASRRGVG
jgi:NhaP-type Na+/H+ or K+/H+ antiporter